MEILAYAHVQAYLWLCSAFSHIFN